MNNVLNVEFVDEIVWSFLSIKKAAVREVVRVVILFFDIFSVMLLCFMLILKKC